MCIQLGVKRVAHATLIIQSLMPILIHVSSDTKCLEITEENKFQEIFLNRLYSNIKEQNWKKYTTCPEFANNYHWNQLADVKINQIYNVVNIGEKSGAHFHRMLGTLINSRIWTSLNQFGSKCLVKFFGTNAYAGKDETAVVVIAITVFHRWSYRTI